MRRLLVLIACLLPLFAHGVEQYRYRVVEKQAQSRDLFTQGMEIHDGTLFFSSGQYGKSRLLRINLATGKTQLARRLNRAFFAEGLTVIGDRIYQLTWQNRVMLVFHRDTLEPLARHSLPGEGWGLTNNGEHLIYSDGSARLHFLDPLTGERQHSITVTESNKPLQRLNELEWINGEIWANIWLQERVVTINPDTGHVTRSINLEGLLQQDERDGTDVLNGIAYDREQDAVWVTGKYWPWRFHIELVPEHPPRAGDSR